MRNLIRVPETKHCQEGVGQEWDQLLLGERSGELGTGDELSGAAAEATAAAAAAAAAAATFDKYLKTLEMD